MMNKDEAVQKLATEGRLSIAHAEDLYDSILPKPVVKQYVADWYEEAKDSFNYDLVEAINNIPYGSDEEDFSDFEKWIDDQDDSLTILVNMHQFGYEVEKETKYMVRFNNFKAIESYLKKDLVKQKYYLGDQVTSRSIVLEHTREKLEEDDFGWVFDCPGVEVKEVE